MGSLTAQLIIQGSYAPKTVLLGLSLIRKQCCRVLHAVLELPQRDKIQRTHQVETSTSALLIFLLSGIPVVYLFSHVSYM